VAEEYAEGGAPFCILVRVQAGPPLRGDEEFKAARSPPAAPSSHPSKTDRLPTDFGNVVKSVAFLSLRNAGGRL
jgi:hypothetical protein